MKAPNTPRWGKLFGQDRVLGTAGIALGVLALLFSPGFVHAGHAGAAGCEHTHVDPAASICDKGVAGKKKCGEDDKGICQDVTTQVLFFDDIPSCLCVTQEDAIPPTVITRMTNATQLGLDFSQTFAALSSGLGSSGGQVACSQLQTAIQDVISDSNTLSALEPMRIYRPKLLNQIDWIITNLPTFASLAISHSSTCSAVDVTLPSVPVTFVQSVLVQKKLELIESRDRLIE